MSIGPSLGGGPRLGPQTGIGGKVDPRPGPNAAHRRARSLLIDSNDGALEVEPEFDQHVDDGWSDADLPELVLSDDLDDDDPAREQPRRPTPLAPKIRWWLDADRSIRWAVRGPWLGTAVPTSALALHEERLTAFADVIASDHPAAVTAPTMWAALLTFQSTPASALLDRMTGGDGANLTRLSPTILQFPWGMTRLGTLTKLARKGRNAPLVTPLVAFAEALADPRHRERLEPGAALKRERLRIAHEHGGTENALFKLQVDLVEVLTHPARVFAARAQHPRVSWERVAKDLGCRELVAVMAVAGAFDDQLWDMFHAARSEEDAR